MIFVHYMQDECSFVSLRDVERAIKVTSWFYKSMDFLESFILSYQGNPSNKRSMNVRLRYITKVNK